MLTRSLQILMLVAVTAAAGTVVMAQDADEHRHFGLSAQEERRRRPRPIKESLERMRIEKDKKEYDEMIERGDEVLRLSKRLEMAFDANGQLNEREMAELAAAEKLARKIRSQLGGDGDDDDGEQQKALAGRMSIGDAVKSFREAAIGLFDELKKTTRFTISAAAIQSANAVVRLARALRISK